MAKRAEENIYANVTQEDKGFEVEAPQRRSGVRVERVALLVLTLLLLAFVFALVGVLIMNGSCPSNSGAKNETTTAYAETVPTCPNNSVSHCGEDWELHGTKCYYFSPHSAKLSWDESKVMCQWLKGNLVKVESTEEQEFLDAKLQTEMVGEEDKFWIGLTDSETEGQWFWTDGAPLNTSLAFWAGNEYNHEPDNWTKEDPEGEDCVRVGQKPLVQGLKGWYDRSCLKEQRSICEKPAKF